MRSFLIDCVIAKGTRDHFTFSNHVHDLFFYIFIYLVHIASAKTFTKFCVILINKKIQQQKKNYFLQKVNFQVHPGPSFQYNDNEGDLGLSSSKMTKNSLKVVCMTFLHF